MKVSNILLDDENFVFTSAFEIEFSSTSVNLIFCIDTKQKKKSINLETRHQFNYR